MFCKESLESHSWNLGSFQLCFDWSKNRFVFLGYPWFLQDSGEHSFQKFDKPLKQTNNKH